MLFTDLAFDPSDRSSEKEKFALLFHRGNSTDVLNYYFKHAKISQCVSRSSLILGFDMVLQLWHTQRLVCSCLQAEKWHDGPQRYCLVPLLVLFQTTSNKLNLNTFDAKIPHNVNAGSE